ncbi:MAG: nitroreductase [Oscillospiraceae bacterium]|nr:nitroreductase [Oscillospiraceae bacterium]
MNEALKVLYDRRSIRRYKSEQISREEMDAVIKAGVCAPSGKNLQSAIIIAVQDRETRDLLSRLNAEVLGVKSDPFYGAPTVLVVLARADSPYAVQDGSLVLGNLMNAAKAIGLGSCWINRAREVFDSEEGKALLKKWGVEGEWIGVGNCILGYPAEDPAIKPRKENFVYYVL